MSRFAKVLFSLSVCLVLFGCAHPISMNPDLARIEAAGLKVVDMQVGYHISDASKAVEVTTPGGGGDKVRYFPYRDLEPGFYKALGEVFKGVTKIRNPKDTAELQASGISMLIVPEISTSSSSPSLMTWPPTQFTLTLTCSISDASGRPVRKLTVVGDGRAEFDEFKSNFSLSAVRAANDALAKLMAALATVDVPR